jgi:hypothetical protein
MEKAFETGRQVEGIRDRALSHRAIAQGNCHRCGGLMVGELCMDLLNSTGELEFAAKRCVQCGEVVDPVILANRAIQRVRVSGSSKDPNTAGPQLWSYAADNNCEGSN